MFNNCRFGLDTNPITLDNVNCFTSNYLTILQCGYSTSISSTCSHGSDDVSVTCCEFLTDNDYFANKLLCIPRSTTPNRCKRTAFGYMLQFCTETVVHVAFVHLSTLIASNTFTLYGSCCNDYYVGGRCNGCTVYVHTPLW